MQDTGSLPTPLTNVERAALELMPSLVAGAFGDPIVASLSDAYRSGLQKVLGSPGGRRHLNQARESTPNRMAPIVADLADVDASDGGRFVDVIAAIRQSRVLEMDYRKLSGGANETRVVDPYVIVPRQSSLYLVAFCHLRQDYRTFKLSRILATHVRDEMFTADQDFQLDAVLRSAWAIDQSGPEVEAELEFTPEVAAYAKEDLALHTVLSETARNDGGLSVRVRARETPEFYRFLLQYGADVRVVSPPSVHVRLAHEARRMKNQYDVDEE